MYCSAVVLSSIVLFWASFYPNAALAKEFKPCNPLVEDSCDGVNQALSSSIVDKFREPSSFFEVFSERGTTEYTDEGLKMTISKRFDNPSIRSNFYILFGKIEVIAKASPGSGVISSVFLQSDDLDEIDLEWIGTNPETVQTNYFAKGDTTDYSRGGYHTVKDLDGDTGNTQTDFHNYTVDWTSEALTFYIDEEEVRRVVYDDQVKEYGYPQTPMAIYIGSWVGGDPGNQPGTIQWAGGLTDFTQGPFTMEVERIVVSDYSSGKNYKYTDKSGDWTSIQSLDGKINGRMEEADTEFSILSNGGSFALNIDNNHNKNKKITKKARRSFIQFSGNYKSSDSKEPNSQKSSSNKLSYSIIGLMCFLLFNYAFLI